MLMCAHAPINFTALCVRGAQHAAFLSLAAALQKSEFDHVAVCCDDLTCPLLSTIKEQIDFRRRSATRCPGCRSSV
jgi:hypothetical protein